MTKLIQETFEQIALLSEEQQDSLATYLKKHLAEFLEEAEKERRIAEGTYTISDCYYPFLKIALRKILNDCKNGEKI